MVIVAGCLLMLLGCATDSKRKWLTFFFDGVPVPGATNTPPQILDEYPSGVQRAQPLAPMLRQHPSLFRNSSRTRLTKVTSARNATNHDLRCE